MLKVCLTSLRTISVGPVSDPVAAEGKAPYLSASRGLGKQIVKCDPPVSSQRRPEIVFYL